MACEQTTNVSKVKVEDRGSRSAVFENAARARYTLTRFDGCVVVDSVACDWLVEKEGAGALAVELKGSDVRHAVDQVAAGVKYLKRKFADEKRLGALIICSRFPATDTSTQIAVRQTNRALGIRLVVKTDGRNLVFESLLSS